AAVLDDDGSATEASGLQNFLQWIPNPYVFKRENSDRNAPIQRNRYQIVSLAETVSWSIPDANRGMSTNSPGTGDLLTSKGVDYRHGHGVPQLLGSIINAIFDVFIIRGPLRH